MSFGNFFDDWNPIDDIREAISDVSSDDSILESKDVYEAFSDNDEDTDSQEDDDSQYYEND